MSWKKYSLEVPSIIIKYEDLVKSPNIYFMKILKFLREILTFEIDEEKFKNTIKSIDFDNLKKFENNEGFDERLHGRFFRQGKIDEWRSQLSDINQKKISMLFKNEMFDLGYL